MRRAATGLRALSFWLRLWNFLIRWAEEMTRNSCYSCMRRHCFLGWIPSLHWFRNTLVVCLGLSMVGCGTLPPPTDSAHDASSSVSGDTYRIGVDDALQVIVWRNPELSVNVPVRPDGMVSVPLLGDVRAGGKTPEAVAANIRERLTQYIRDPNVTIVVSALRSHEFLSRVRVTGAVRNPRSMPHRPGMTVLDAVLEAGGINDFASANRTRLYRRGADNKTSVFGIDLGDILNSGQLETNVTLRPGDIIAVPERLF